jgi:hypothetical protein
MEIVVATLTLALVTGIARSEVSVIGLASSIVKNNIGDEANGRSDIGKQICDASGRPSYDCSSSGTIGSGICLSKGRPSYDCSSSTTIGQGICLVGGRPSYDCSSSTTIGQGICLSTGRPSYECSFSLTPADGLCMAKGHPSYNCSSLSASAALAMEIIDLDWAWDKFYDSTRNEQWRCRGLSTGQFADNAKCSGKPKVDDTWPGMQL